MKRWMFNYHSRVWKRVACERGVTTIEWVALAAVVVILLAAIVAVVSRGDIARAGDCAMQRQAELFGGRSAIDCGSGTSGRQPSDAESHFGIGGASAPPQSMWSRFWESVRGIPQKIGSWWQQVLGQKPKESIPPVASKKSGFGEILRPKPSGPGQGTSSYNRSGTVNPAQPSSKILTPYQGFECKTNLSQRYGNPSSRYTQGYHPGVDYGIDEGTPLYAVFGGKVIGIKKGGYNDGAGSWVKIQAPDGTQIIYEHMLNIDPDIVKAYENGESIEAGKQIGTSNGDPDIHGKDAGNSTGAHLHFEVRDKDGKVVDQMGVLGCK